MNLPKALPAYSQGNESETRQTIMQWFNRLVRKGDTVRFGRNECLIQSPDGSWWAVKVDDTGALSTEARS